MRQIHNPHMAQKDTRVAARNALIMMRDHAQERMKAYATRHRLRETGWHFMIDSSIAMQGGVERVTESALVIMRCTGPRFFCVRISVDSDQVTSVDAPAEILEVDQERVAHLIFDRSGWTQTKSIKRQSDKIIENATPAPDQDD
jgi:hypothetical protein